MSAEKIVLQNPIEIETKEGKATITEVVVSKLKAKHLKVIPATMLEGKPTNPAKLFPLLSALTGLSVESIGELSFPDFEKVAGAVTDRMGEAIAPEKTGNS